MGGSKRCYIKRCKQKEKTCEIGLWADWSPCSPECGEVRKKTRSRNVKVNEEGATCPPANQTLPCEAKKCKTCPVTDWGEWGPCDCETKKRASTRIMLRKKTKCVKLTRQKDCEDSYCQ